MSIKVRIPNVPELILDFGELANNHFISTGDMPNWEPLETQIFIALLSDNPKIVDMGANIGWFTTIGAKISGRKGELYSFEPDHLTIHQFKTPKAVEGAML